ncbi:MAG: 3-deoxy-7-phosphoheptulonate synthase [Candidatus Taylorbacteria bacterium RIFCSPHIGHO2_01_FULL_46_22b]|uniref:Phospho-2-dehydro-3-deoxyheptonate aldolase n=1 Tax=Candidatus Taylorbacteria bacterium RIFCSPHIGHO2_01_FULL_46_22b TaxID=1802301 RepID=A0A1G2M3R9_9BACT|nr:MAG: 3-deoxy-7-phosphoheptulonate synthase [Candidatus Taylorbacteria bacterium RIFCSPHIGHO2_01_FULL_46_22b]
MNGNPRGTEGMSDWNITSATPMPKLSVLKHDIPLSEEVFDRVVRPARVAIQNILAGEDKRFLIVVGPCSIHNTNEAGEYASKLLALIPEVSDQLFIVMRTCLDKPRSGLGWPGFFMDPDLNGSKKADEGWRKGRKLLVEIVTSGVPVGLELLDAHACQVVDECAAYWWIGARTVTSQRLREIASGLSTPVGFKNPTEGDIAGAIEAIETARHHSAFLAINQHDILCEYRTSGNQFGHLILRGSSKGPNYDEPSVAKTVHQLAQRGLPTELLVDLNHANSGKDHRLQREILADVVGRVVNGNTHLRGVLYESYLEGGKQIHTKDLSLLKPRLSITDGCDSWEDTREALLRARDALAKRA